MADAQRRYSGDVPIEIEDRLRESCMRLPDAYAESVFAPKKLIAPLDRAGHDHPEPA